MVADDAGCAREKAVEGTLRGYDSRPSETRGEGAVLVRVMVSGYLIGVFEVVGKVRASNGEDSDAVAPGTDGGGRGHELLVAKTEGIFESAPATEIKMAVGFEGTREGVDPGDVVPYPIEVAVPHDFEELAVESLRGRGDIREQGYGGEGGNEGTAIKGDKAIRGGDHPFGDKNSFCLRRTEQGNR